MCKIPSEFPPSIDNAVKNLTDHPTSNIGQTLGDIWFLVFGGISQAAEKRRLKYSHDLEQFKAGLNESIEAIPPENLVEPDFQTVALALESSKYCVTSEDLRTMFTNLISGSMDKDYESKVHPSFPETLKQMSSNDAQLLQYLKENSPLPTMTLSVVESDGGILPAAKDIFLACSNLSSNQATLSAASLERAGLISISRDGMLSLHDRSRYTPFEDLPIFKEIQAQCDAYGRKLHKMEGACQLTNLGEALIEVCIR